MGLTIEELVRIVTWRANIYSGNVSPRPANWFVGGLIWDDLAGMPGRAALRWRHGGSASGWGVRRFVRHESSNLGRPRMIEYVVGWMVLRVSRAKLG